MSRRTLISSIAAVILTATFLAPMSQAQNAEADCRNLPGERSDDGWTSHEQLGQELAQIEATSSGRVTVDVIGHSHRGREIYAARVGTGDRVLLVTSEIHGNEKTGTGALLEMLKTLGSSDSPQAQAVREGMTLVAVPKFNPDGAELNRRQNDFPWADVVATYPQLAGMTPPFYFSSGAGGFDLNRDFNADLSYDVPQPQDRPANESQPGMYLTNEARALRDLYVSLRDEFDIVDGYVDLHHMGPCSQQDGARPNLVTIDPPSSAAGSYEAAGATSGPTPTRQGLSGEIVLVNDGTDNPTRACQPLVGFPDGSIALIDRNPCPGQSTNNSHLTKINNAQDAGAVAVIMVNHLDTLPGNVGGNDPEIMIPVVHISRADGDLIKAGLPATGGIKNVVGQYVTVALDHPPLGSDADGNPQYSDWPLLDQDKSRRFALAAALGLYDHAGGGNAELSPFFGGVTRYIHNQVSDGYATDRNFAGQARSAFALNGSGTVLFEVRGQQDAWGQKQMGMLTQVVLTGLWGIAERMADGSIDELNGDDFYNLPKYW